MRSAAWMVLLAACATQDIDRGWLLHDQGPIVWRRARLPQRVVVDVRLGPWDEAYATAVAWWNFELGLNLLEYAGTTGEELQPNTAYVMLDPSVSNPTTRVTHKDGSILTAQVRHPETNWTSMHEDKRIIMAAHELGHVLGLADDQMPGSIMHGILLQYLDNIEALDITSGDRKRLEEAYGSRPSQR